jgi:hypothetical protein
MIRLLRGRHHDAGHAQQRRDKTNEMRQRKCLASENTFADRPE